MCIRDRSKIGPDDLRYLSETSQPSYAICESDTDGQLLVETTLGPVSYTHLDVYKRQG